MGRLAKRLNATLLRPEVDAALSPDTLALVLLAMVRLKWKASPQLAGLVARRSAEGTSPTLSRMDPEELSQLAWSFARLRFQPGPDWQMAFEEHALRCAFRFNLLHISKTKRRRFMKAFFHNCRGQGRCTTIRAPTRSEVS